MSPPSYRKPSGSAHVPLAKVSRHSAIARVSSLAARINVRSSQSRRTSGVSSVTRMTSGVSALNAVLVDFKLKKPPGWGGSLIH
jgi:hypothetical protein